MSNSKRVSTSLLSYFKLNFDFCPTLEKDKDMKNIPYVSVNGNLMYVMVCTRPDIAHIVGVVSRFLFNLSKDHWQAVKWIVKYLMCPFKVCLWFVSGDFVLDD